MSDSLGEVFNRGVLRSWYYRAKSSNINILDIFTYIPYLLRII